MDWSLIEQDGGRTYVLVAEEGEDALAVLNELSITEHITAAQITAVGAFARARVGWFDRAQRKYEPIEINEQCELLSLIGDVALGNGGPAVHAHVVVGLRDGTTRGGHLLAAEVNPTLEVIVRESPATLRKTDRPDIGLALIDLSIPA